MAYIFLDESGDLGFDFEKQRTSKFFLVTILFIDQKRPIEKLIRKIHAGLRKKFKMRTSTLHAAKEETANIIRICGRQLLPITQADYRGRKPTLQITKPRALFTPM